jgi:hypothetical protein
MIGSEQSHGIESLGRLDPDDGSTIVRQHPRGRRASHHPCEIEDFDIRERERVRVGCTPWRLGNTVGPCSEFRLDFPRVLAHGRFREQRTRPENRHASLDGEGWPGPQACSHPASYCVYCDCTPTSTTSDRHGGHPDKTGQCDGRRHHQGVQSQSHPRPNRQGFGHKSCRVHGRDQVHDRDSTRVSHPQPKPTVFFTGAILL